MFKFSEYSRYKKIVFISMFIIMTTALFSSMKDTFSKENIDYFKIFSDLMIYYLGVFVAPEFFDQRRKLQIEQIKHPENFEQDKRKWKFNGQKIAFWILLVLAFPIFYNHIHEDLSKEIIDVWSIIYNIMMYLFVVIFIPPIFENKRRKT